MTHYLFTSESVGVGHPDKIADQISDAILDHCLEQDRDSRVACETLVSPGLVIIAGEISADAKLEIQDVARETIAAIGYRDCALGFDFRSCGIITTINHQSADIARGIDTGPYSKELGAGDQGIMFGYASDETPQLMPMPIMVAHGIVRALKEMRESGELSYLRPDAKSQVTIEYRDDHTPLRIHSVVISAQHSEQVKQETLSHDMRALVEHVAPEGFVDDKTIFYINPTGRFVIGGPVADCGLTGRKIIVDTYGGMGRHGGGAFSGKDATKVDRSASYAARYVAKNIVAARLARRCEVQLSYAIGVAHPISIKVNTFGTGEVSEALLERLLPHVFDLSPKGIIETLQLQRPIFCQTAFGGHFGRSETTFTWEGTNAAAALKRALKEEPSSIEE